MARRRSIKNRPLKEKELLPRFLAAARAERETVQAPCAHFGICGGCELQDLSYADQLQVKQDMFASVVAHFGADDLLPRASLGEIPIVASPQPLGYRQRMDYIVAFGKAGQRKKGEWKSIIHLDECHLPDPGNVACLHRAYELVEEIGLRHYNFIHHNGFLRYLSVRRTRHGQTMLLITTKTREHEAELDRIAATLLTEGLADSVWWLLNETLTDQAGGEPLRHWGQEFIEERLAGCRFLIGHSTFFQSNAAVGEIAYEQIRDWLRPHHPELALDVYAGTATIAAVLAGVCRQVVAVESEAANCAVARRMIALNQLEGIQIVQADAEEWLAGFAGTIDAMVVNPPRKGLGERNCHRLIELAPTWLPYMSCNPNSLIRDLRILAQDYEILDCQLLDMFPQTRHFETLVLLRKK